MFVSKISNSNKNTLTFGSTNREVYRNGKLLYKNKTNFFRDDLDWKAFVTFLNNKYQNTDKVNIINCACSDGSESFSLAVLLMKKLKSAAQKFFPIKASDCDSAIINRAKNGPCNISDKEFYVINEYTKSRYFKYFDAVPPSEGRYDMGLMPTEILKSNINFKQSDVLTELESLQPENNVILCRNFWTYLDPKDVGKMIEIFKNKLNKSSTIVTGELEEGCGFNNLLKKIGFKESPRNVFEKIK